MQIRSFKPSDSPGVKTLITSIMNRDFAVEENTNRNEIDVSEFTGRG